MSGFLKGADLSTLLEVEACGGRFSDRGEPGGAMEILKRYGMNLVRLRLWHTPYGPGGEPFGAGTNDLERTVRLARRAKGLGLDWLLDFHYSDFWADPGKQLTPRAWRGLDAEELERAVYDYTKAVMLRLKAEDLLPAMTAVGNEITHGLLWPLGQTPHFENIARFTGAGIRAVKDADLGQPVMLHLDNGGDRELYRNWFTRYFAAGGADFDCIGMSFYPYWSGTLEQLERNMAELAERWGKDILIAETALGFSTEDYAEYERLPQDRRKGSASDPEALARLAYPVSPEGQSAFLRDLAEVVRRTPGGRGLGFVWWEPAWLPVPGSGWASPAALEYMKNEGPGGNEWANQTLFDYDGRVLPSLETFAEL